jgi:hypothetical protein
MTADIMRQQITEEMWVEWLRPEVDRCTPHNEEIWIAHDKGPACEIALELGAVYHHLEQAVNGFPGERYIEPCLPDARLSDRERPVTIDLARERPTLRKSRVTRYAVDVRCDRCGGTITAGQPVRCWPLGGGAHRVHVVGSGEHYDMVGFCCCVDCVEP